MLCLGFSLERPIIRDTVKTGCMTTHICIYLDSFLFPTKSESLKDIQNAEHLPSDFDFDFDFDFDLSLVAVHALGMKFPKVLKQ